MIRAVAARMARVMGGWRRIARADGISEASIEFMADCFESGIRKLKAACSARGGLSSGASSLPVAVPWQRVRYGYVSSEERVMILFFSATGNSGYVAKRLADGLSDERLDLFDRIPR